MLRLSSLLGIEVRRGGASLGRLVDLGAAAERHGSRPAVESAWVRRGRHEAIGVDLREGFELGEDRLVLEAASGRVARAEAGLLLARHVLDAQLIDLQEKRLVRVGEVLIEEARDGLRLAGVEIGARPVLRRLGLAGIGSRRGSETIDWADLHFTTTRADTLQLSVPRSAIRHLPPEEIGARPGRRYGAVMRARRHAPR